MPSDERSRSNGQRLLDVALALAEGRPVDWQATAVDEHGTSAILRRLRALEELSDAFHEATASADLTTTARGEIGTPRFTWGHLRVLRPLGKGGFGEVYLAWDSALDRKVALKLHQPSAPSTAGRFAFDEARRLARVRHRNVLTVHGAAVHDGIAGLWSDFIEGQTLDRLLSDRGPFGAGEVVTIGNDLCLALAALHAAGIVHGDVKASNVMREHGGRIVLMDLDAGRPVAGHSPGPVCATRAAAAPEVLQGAPPTPASDIYSLGALLFRLLTGAGPQETSTSLSDLRPDIPVVLARVIDRALLDDPTQRFPSPGAMRRALHQALDQADAVDATRRGRVKAGRRWWLAAVGATSIGVAAILAPAVGSLQWFADRGERPLRISSQRSIASSSQASSKRRFRPTAGASRSSATRAEAPRCGFRTWRTAERDG